MIDPCPFDAGAAGYQRNAGSDAAVCVSCRLLGSPCSYHVSRAVRLPQSDLARLMRAAEVVGSAALADLLAEARAAAPMAGELPPVETLPHALVAVAAGREASLRGEQPERFAALALAAIASDAKVAAFRRLGGRAPRFPEERTGEEAPLAPADAARLAAWHRSEALWLSALARTVGGRVPDRAADLVVEFAWGPPPELSDSGGDLGGSARRRARNAPQVGESWAPKTDNFWAAVAYDVSRLQGTR